MTTSNEAEKRFSDWQELQRDKIRNQDGQLQMERNCAASAPDAGFSNNMYPVSRNWGVRPDWLPHLGGNAMTS
jgi:hypothetical protein